MSEATRILGNMASMGNYHANVDRKTANEIMMSSPIMARGLLRHIICKKIGPDVFSIRLESILRAPEDWK